MSDPDPDDDPQLRSLRAVWLSLPEEEPPERGLAELMAAARAKAEIMARPAWWRRVLDVLRRPPVLALATVIVLIGGAVLVGKEKDAIEVESRPAAVTGSAPAAPSTGSGSATNDRVGAPAEPEPPVDTTVARPKTETQAPAADVPAPPKPSPTPKPKRAPKELKVIVTSPPRKAPAPAHTATKRESLEQGVGGMDFEGSPAPVGASSAPAPVLAPEPAPTKAADPGATRTAKPPPAPPPPQEAPAYGRKSDSAGGGAPAQNDEAAPSVSRLIAQCRAAASRGDCATVKTLAAQIASQDQAAYRAQIAGDSAIRRCLGN